MLETLYLKALISLYLLSWNAAAYTYHPELIQPIVTANGYRWSSMIFPVTGNVYPLGYYYVTMHIGHDRRPYFLDIDTGSVLTWLQCDAPCQKCTRTPHSLYKPSPNRVPCQDPICASLHGPEHQRQKPDEQCDYEIQYADHGSSLGVLIRDSFLFKLTNGATMAPSLALGCGYDQEFKDPKQVPYTDGVLGLGIGRASIVAQLRDIGVTRDVIGHCFSGRGGGFLFFGDAFVHAPGIVWTPILSQSVYYSLGPADLQYGGQATNIKGIPIVFDSGATYSYFISKAYSALVSVIKNSLHGKDLKEVKDRNLPICWKGRRLFTSLNDVAGYFKPMRLSFGNARNVHFQLQLAAYLIITEHGNVCLGILDGTEAGLEDQNLIGDISLQDKMVIYDNERHRVGWAAADCNRRFKS